MTKPNEWPVCTAHPGCGHAVVHDSPGAADAFAREHKAEYVNRNGYAVCECHELTEAVALGVTRFPCGVAA